MENRKEIQIQFRLTDVRPVQFVNLSDQWPEGELQISNQLQFNSDTDKRVVRCTAHFEYKKNDITQLIITVQCIFEYARESWSALYHLQGDEWILPAGLVQHMADLTIGATRGILAVKSEESGLPRIVLPMLSAAQFIKNNMAIKRSQPQGNA